MKKTFTRPYKDEYDLEKAFPDPPFGQKDYEAIRLEVDEIAKRFKGTQIRDQWIVKHNGGRIREGYGLSVFPGEYRRLSKRWDEFTQWAAKREYGEGKRLAQYAKISTEGINKLI